MPDIKIDYNRPLIKGKDQASGVEVYMFLDEPGIYRSNQNTIISETLAEKAGFDTKKFKIERVKAERMAAAKKAIEDQLAADENSEKKVVLERNGWMIVGLALGRHYIEDPDGNAVSDRTMTEEEARLVFDQLVPVEEEVPVEEPKKGKKG